MRLDPFVDSDSPIHRADPRVKLVVAIAFIVAVALVPGGAFVALTLAWLAVLVVAATARVPLGRLLRRSAIALPFLLAVLPIVLTTPAERFEVRIGPLELAMSGAGLRQFATIAAISWVSVQAALVLAMTTPFHDLVDGLRQLRLPRILVAIVGFIYRYLDVLDEEAARMLRARASRSAERDGLRPGGTLRWRATTAGRLVGSLFLRSYERSERIHAAMQARGFDGQLRAVDGPRLATVQLAWLLASLAGIAGWVAASHLWLPHP